MKRVRRFLTVLLAMCLLLGTTVFAYSDAVNEARNGVLQINLTYVSDAGEEIILQSGSGFLINDEMLITNYHVIVMQDETRAALREIPGLEPLADLAINDPHLHIKVVVQRDMTVEANCHSSAYSAEVDFAVIRLVEKIYDRVPLALGDSDKIRASEQIYALGMPATSINTTESHTSEDVMITSGVASKLTELNGIKVVEHDVKISGGSSGGPMVNESGEVIAVNSYGGEDYYYSIQINHIKNALNTFGIAYTSASTDTDVSSTPEETATPEPEPSDEPAPAPTTDTDDVTVELRGELQDEIKEAQNAIADASSYTDASVQLVQDAIADANDTLDNEDATAASLQNSIDSLKSAVRGLEEKSGPNMVVILVVAAVAVVVILVVIILVVKSSGKKKANRNQVTAGPSNVPNGIPIAPPPARPMDTPTGQQNAGYTPPVPQTPPYPYAQGSSDPGTTVLNQGAGETTLLNAGPAATLLRKKTGQKVTVSGNRFMIGKEKNRVNFCISDNSSISRVHAEIVKKGADYYIVDQNSTNGTFVNGVKANPREETLLREGAIIKLSDEEFEFHV